MKLLINCIMKRRGIPLVSFYHATAIVFCMIVNHSVYAQQSCPSYNCTIVIVGAGSGGLFTAMRLAESYASVSPSNICMFERTNVIGGEFFFFCFWQRRRVMMCTTIYFRDIVSKRRHCRGCYSI